MVSLSTPLSWVCCQPTIVPTEESYYRPQSTVWWTLSEYVLSCVVSLAVHSARSSLVSFTLPDRRRYGYRRHSGYDTSTRLAGGLLQSALCRALLLVLPVTDARVHCCTRKAGASEGSGSMQLGAALRRKPRFHHNSVMASPQGQAPVHDW